MNHAEFEAKLMEMLLAGHDSTLDGLRSQYANSIVEAREFTGAGFFSKFQVKTEIKPVAGGKTLEIGDVWASWDRTENAFRYPFGV